MCLLKEQRHIFFNHCTTLIKKFHLKSIIGGGGGFQQEVFFRADNDKNITFFSKIFKTHNTLDSTFLLHKLHFTIGWNIFCRFWLTCRNQQLESLVDFKHMPLQIHRKSVQIFHPWIYVQRVLKCYSILETYRDKW